MNKKCLICKKDILGISLILSSAQEIHQVCQQTLEERITDLQLQLGRLSKPRDLLLQDISSFEYRVKAISLPKMSSWILDKAFGYLNAAETERRAETIRLNGQIKNLKLLLLSESDKEAYERKKITKEIEEIKNVLSPIYEYWPSYPPDWGSRCAAVRERDGMCKKCRYRIHLKRGRRKIHERRDMHVHHVIHIAKGGSHKIENLILLCESCHEKKHVHGFSEKINYRSEVEDRKTSSTFTNKISKIKHAIDNGKFLKFRYTNFKGETSTRTIKPHSIEKDSFKGKNMNVNGFCYLRKENRHFNISKMRELIIIDEINQAS